jgi:hypothetical protein
MLKGLKEVDAALARKHIPFYLLQGQAPTTVPALASELQACCVVTDFSPLREPLAAATAVGRAMEGSSRRPVLQVGFVGLFGVLFFGGVVGLNSTNMWWWLIDHPTLHITSTNHGPFT